MRIPFNTFSCTKYEYCLKQNKCHKFSLKDYRYKIKRNNFFHVPLPFSRGTPPQQQRWNQIWNDNNLYSFFHLYSYLYHLFNVQNIYFLLKCDLMNYFWYFLYGNLFLYCRKTTLKLSPKRKDILILEVRFTHI